MACLEDDALAYLCQGKWPCLQILGLSQNSLFDCPHIQVEAAWSSLKEVRLAHCKFPDLTPLYLHRLHDIEVIDLLGSCVNIICVQLLVQADWPKLITLRLNGREIDEAGVQDLIRGNWPQLERLYLSHIDLHPEVVQVLSQGCWPKLRKLDLCNGRCKLRGVEGIQSLVHAQWPLLECYVCSMCLKIS